MLDYLLGASAEWLMVAHCLVLVVIVLIRMRGGQTFPLLPFSRSSLCVIGFDFQTQCIPIGCRVLLAQGKVYYSLFLKQGLAREG